KSGRAGRAFYRLAEVLRSNLKPPPASGAGNHRLDDLIHEAAFLGRGMVSSIGNSKTGSPSDHRKQRFFGCNKLCYTAQNVRSSLQSRIEPMAQQQPAASELFQRYAGRLIALARSRLSTKVSKRVDPEDVVQSAYRSFFAGARDGCYDLERGGDVWQ